MKKVFVLTQESNIDGEIYFCVNLFEKEESAKEALANEKSRILNESHHYSGYPEEEYKESFTVEDSDKKFFIMDNSDDYYEELNIFEKEIRI
jgi:hypothetical protein